ncbi:MAG TPA: UDP-N-acetylmuramoyl-L-alanyl-D-glutamate--2,6-diaminopimelate ligase [Bacteroidales bacterium]|nr:UDP-N-acetylmuramoyl-L-alanyl-D-glutamate--2,6-diaminopimelate ligase [Bacteroidales bacterium]
MRRLSEILEGIDYRTKDEECDPGISSVCFDSRKVRSGDLFVAVPGTQTDGHRFINDAVSAGAVAVVCSNVPEEADPAVCWISVDDPSFALGLIASNYYNRPSSTLRLVGITGTNGKTTTATLLYRLFSSLGYKAGLLSTVKNYVADREFRATLTTPDPLVINSYLREMCDAGCEYAFMEVSSHAVKQNRIAGLDFSLGIFTNITHDHLDYHGTFDDYLAAKKKFFDDLPAGSAALVNIDDRNGEYMLQNTPADKCSYSLRSVADYKCRILEHRLDGMNIRFGNDDVWTRFIGEFNAYNLLAVSAAADLMGQDRTEVLTALTLLKPVPGRFEFVRSAAGTTAIVDYAHTPDALDNVLRAINKLKRPLNRVITVIGAGGDRDRSKRPVMGEISALKSDRVILTSDNPRSEDPADIINDMLKGVPEDKRNNVLSISDRREAIRTAAMLADKDCIILVAGKGHETYQEIKGVRHHFDDREELEKVFTSLN